MKDLLSDTLSRVGIERMTTRYGILCQEMTEFIVIAGFEKCITVNRELLFEAIINYFNTVSRCKEYHIHEFHELKVVSYMAYYLLQSKPLVVRDNVHLDNDKIRTINERFVLLFLLNYMSGQLGNTHILLQNDAEVKLFCKNLFYMLISHFENVYCLENLISSFLHSRI